MAVPQLVYRFFFAIAFLNTLITLWTICKLIHLIPGLGDKKKRYEYSIATSSTIFKYLMLFPCPWIKVHGLEELELAWNKMRQDDGGAPYVIANHNSKLDSLLVTALLPVNLGPKMRSLIKEALFYEPLFGGICEAVGHFPVFFKGSSEGDFGVNKEKQAKVAKEMDEFVGSGGGLLIFPEGQLNRKPRTLQPLRRGAFSVPISHKKAIWGFLNVGCEKCWPHKSAIGGNASDIYVRAFKITDDASQFDNTKLADYAGEVMQKNLNEMYTLADEKSHTA